MDFNKIDNVYFIGIGGIGMSAIARYFNFLGKKVSGYDRTQTELTDALLNEGIDIHFNDDVSLIGDEFKDKDRTLIIFTPAIPAHNLELNYFIDNGYEIFKRAEVLGLITINKKGIGIAGTHGKTTVTTLTSHLLKQSHVDCSAFLGGISKNYESNLLVSDKSEYVVVEADEFDRSFLNLYPNIAVITSMDADHLDIYGKKEHLINSFNEFANQINKGGKLIIKKGLDYPVVDGVETLTYSINEKADFYTENLKIVDGCYEFDVVTPDNTLKGIRLGMPGRVNVENSIAAIAVAHSVGVTEEEIKASLKDFHGINRRFDVQIKTDKVIFIDDYAHHPEELNASIGSVKELYPNKKVTGIFQPHLFTRTRDFVDGFAEALSKLDKLILLDIYPARELPIEGVSSKIILDKVTLSDKMICSKEELLDVIKKEKIEVLITLGAGDIDKLVKPIKSLLKEIY